MLLNRFCFRHISHYAGLLFRVYADWRKERAVNLEQLIGRLKKTPSFMENVTHWETIPAKEASFAPFPAELDNRLPPVLAQRGVYKLYSHQREAFDLAATGKDICVVTPTASGKTMCYNLPVLNAILKNNDARATRLPPRADRCVRQGTSSSPIRICYIQAFCRTTPNGSSCLKT